MSAALALAGPEGKPGPITAETRIARLDALLHAIFSTIHADARAGDPGNVDAIGWLTLIAQDEVWQLQHGLKEGRAMDIDCGR